MTRRHLKSRFDAKDQSTLTGAQQNNEQVAFSWREKLLHVKSFRKRAVTLRISGKQDQQMTLQTEGEIMCAYLQRREKDKAWGKEWAREGVSKRAVDTFHEYLLQKIFSISAEVLLMAQADM